MKNFTYIFLLITNLSCNSKQTTEEETVKLDNETAELSKPNDTVLIIGERIDGPANIRNKPNGDVLFELYDNALVEVSTKPQNDWYEVLVYADIDYSEYGMDSILKNRPIIVNRDTIGKVLKSHSVGTGRGRDFAYAMLYGYTHRNNIRPETVIETVFKKHLSENGRKASDWNGFIHSFQLHNDAIGYESFETFYNYENSIEDPSPGFRIVLLFEKERLIGLIHSRELQIDNTKTHRLNWSYYVTFFQDYPDSEQLKFVGFMNEWLQGVD